MTTKKQLQDLATGLQAQLNALTVAINGLPGEAPSTSPVASAGNILTLKVATTGNQAATTGSSLLKVGMMVRFANGRTTPVATTQDGVTFTTREPAADSAAGLAALAGTALTVVSVPGATVDPTPTPEPQPLPDGTGLFCLNIGQLAGGDTILPGKIDQNFFAASAAQISRWADRGVKRTRVAITWERVQPKLFGDLDATYLGYVKDQLDQHAAKGLQVLVDVHNYAGYSTTKTSDNRQKIGTTAVPFGALADLHRRLAAAFKGHAAFYGLDLMNEPTDMPSGADGWAKEAQLCINSIRTVDPKCAIAVEAYSWGTTARFKSAGNEKLLKLVDPSKNTEIHTHIYMDVEGGGKYVNDAITRGEALTAVKTVHALCLAADLKYCLGEVGAPGDYPNSMAELRDVALYCRDNGIDAYWWWATETAKDNIMSLEADRNSPVVKMLAEVYGG